MSEICYAKAVPDGSQKSGRLEAVELVRGLAAVSVCVFHFTKYLWPDHSIVRQLGSFGWAGVESFFVISGFIIPFAMHRAGYRPANFFQFIAKRYLRLTPPYLAAIVLAIALWFAAGWIPGFRGEPFRFERDRLIAHLFFANDIVGIPWLNPVFWTLAIEFQYYLAIGLLFPILFSRSQWVNLVFVILLGGMAWVPIPESLVTRWVLIFLVGIILAQWQLQCLTSIRAGFLGLALATLIWLHHGAIIFTASSLTVLLILYVRRVPRWAIGIGHLSYAIYLVHVPIGGRVINIGNRFATGELMRWFILSAAFALSFSAAWLLWGSVERYAIKWSSRIKYSKRIIKHVPVTAA